MLLRESLTLSRTFFLPWSAGLSSLGRFFVEASPAAFWNEASLVQATKALMLLHTSFLSLEAIVSDFVVLVNEDGEVVWMGKIERVHQFILWFGYVSVERISEPG